MTKAGRKQDAYPLGVCEGWPRQGVKQSEYLINLRGGFAYKARSCRASEEDVGLVPEGLLVAIYAVAVLVLLSPDATREM